MSWSELRLGDAIRVKHGFAFRGEFFVPHGKLMVVTPGNFLEQGGFDEEEQRYLREGFASEKELAVFDLLSRDNVGITKGQIDKIKKVARELMATVEMRRSEMGDLRDRASAPARMKSAIIERLLAGMPTEYSSEDIELRAEVVFQYVQQQHSSSKH